MSANSIEKVEAMQDELRSAGERLRFARTTAARVRDEAKAVALQAVQAGVSESAVAQLVGVDRMTVRNWRGKR